MNKIQKTLILYNFFSKDNTKKKLPPGTPFVIQPPNLIFIVNLINVIFFNNINNIINIINNLNNS